MISSKTVVFLILLSLSYSSAKLGGKNKERELQISDRECYTNTQRLTITDTDPTYLLGECTGDCDDDSDCEGDLICFQRDAFGYVPSCAGGTSNPSRTDFCIHPSAITELQFCGSNPSQKLAQCQGDCDDDTDCEGDLVCFQRDAYTDVPGCTGGRVDASGTDFCVKQSDLEGSSRTEIKFVGSDPTQTLGRCEGDCDTDEDCEGDLVCFQRSDCMYVPGCDGGFDDYSRSDYCVRKSDVSAGELTLEITLDYPIQLCQGDCDSNYDCAPGLICQQRDANEPVIGCIGGENDSSLSDYCISPNNRGNHRKSVLESSLGEGLKPYNEEAMDWLINVDLWVPPEDEQNPRDLWRERYAMTAFYFSTEGDKWFNPRSYLTPDSVCRWSGYGDEIEVNCDENGRVISVIGRENGMLGYLPPAMQALTMLRRIDFYRNNIRGSIPSELGLLTHLTRIDLYENNLTGSIPKELGGLTRLEQLSLYDNALTGKLPETIWMCTNLRELNLNDNSISGSIPATIGALRRLQYLELSNNRLTGTLSNTFSNLRDLEHLFLSHNRMSGSLSGSTIGTMTSLKYFDLRENKFHGSIPTEIGLLSNLNTMDFAYNDFDGNIPSEIGLLDRLNGVNLRGNELSGSLPSEMVNMDFLLDFDARSNKLTGDIPPLPSSLRDCELENNRFADTSNAQGICGFGH